MKTFIILNYLGHEVGRVEVKDGQDPLAIFAASRGIESSQKIIDAGYKAKEI